MNFFLNDLNEEQKEAVLSHGNPQLVLSGAGSGKTRVLTYKIIYLLKIQNIPPENILALTFTNKAANEMKERIIKLIGFNYARKLVMGTFHSIFCKILRKNIIYLEGNKYKSDFQIIVEHESIDIIKKIIEDDFNVEFEFYLDVKEINDNTKRKGELRKLSKSFKKKISLLKNKGITHEKYFNLQQELQDDQLKSIPFFKNVYKNYVLKCQEKNLMDFDDLLLNTMILFSDKNNIKILEKYQNIFQYILVDEYQDTNPVQYEIIKALAWNNKNIFVVGDDYQNIYSFRGASKLNIDYFKNNFSGCKETKLCQNYRSNSTIVEVSNKLIKNNKHQIFKNLFSKIKETDGRIKLLTCKNGIDEASKVAFIILELIKNKKCNYKDIVILYRMNKQFYPFKTIFFKRGIPHKIFNAKSIFESKIIKTIYYYLRYIDDQSSDYFLSKIINFPKRNIGKASVDKLLSMSKSKGINCWKIINNCDNSEIVKEYGISKDLQSKLLPFKKIITYLISFSKTNRLYKIIEEMISYLKLDSYLQDESTREQIELLKEKVEEMEQEHIKISLEKFTLSEFLEEFSLLVDNEENDEEESKKDRVKLMTIHQAKGLEFKYVFIVGLEEGYYPCGKYVTDEEELEEERRIFYVAITRAKINCYLSYAEERLFENEFKKREESRFLSEIKDYKYIEYYNFENNDNYRNYENRYKNEFIESKIDKSKKIENKNKDKYSKSSLEPGNNNIKNKFRKNHSQNLSKVKNIHVESNYKNKGNIIQIEKLDNNMIIEERKESQLKENNEIDKSKENLNNDENKKINKKKKRTRERSRSRDKSINKSKSKIRYKTIDSFFNLK